MLAALAVLSTMHYEGDVPAAGGDYQEVPFVVPTGAVECQIHHDDGSDYDILDWGIWDDQQQWHGWGGGLSDDAIIGVAESSRGYIPGLHAGTWNVVIGKAQLDQDGGHYSIDVTCRDDATLTPQPRAAFMPMMLSTERRWYKGDFHVHSHESGDASATFDQIHDLAISRGLDFINLSDHNTIAQHDLIAAYQQSHPDLLFLRSSEVTTYAGHGNAVGISHYVDHRIGFNGLATPALIADAKRDNSIFIVNHPTLDLGTACIGCKWNHPDTPWDQVDGLEILTGNYDISHAAFTPKAIELWDAQLDAGHRIAPIGGSDDHKAGMMEGNPPALVGSPTTLVLADDLSEASIIDAVKAGRTVVMLRGPDDPMVELTVNGVEIGGEDQSTADVPLQVHVTGGDGYLFQVWRDGEKLNQDPVTGADFTTTYTDHTTGPHRYRVELIDDTNQRVTVTGHIFVTAVAADPGCGCRTTSRGDALPLALVLLCLKRRRFDAVALK